jgi:hypothetical protein
MSLAERHGVRSLQFQLMCRKRPPVSFRGLVSNCRVDILCGITKLSLLTHRFLPVIASISEAI